MAINFDHQRDRLNTSSGVLTVNTFGALTIPVGTTAQRPGTTSTGQIRFNSNLQSFEGYNGSAWSSLGGVIDVDQDTKITVESAPGADEDTLTFITAGVDRARIDETGKTFLLGDLDVAGDVTIGGNITIGDANTDAITVTADFDSNLRPDQDNTYDLGSINNNWQTVFARNLDSNTEIVTVDTTGAFIVPVGTELERPALPESGMIRFNSDTAVFETYNGTIWEGVGIAGTPTDGTWQDGAYLGFSDSDRVADVLDELNESIENVRNNTFVRSVTFTADSVLIGSGNTVTLTIVTDGNPTNYDIDWGDGSVTTGTADSTPSHVYNTNVGSPFTVTVRAYNSNAISGSAGSEASSTRIDYIAVFTADPSAEFELYNVLTGGTALFGNNNYVIEGGTLYLENNTSNTIGSDVTYEVDWGDGSAVDTVASDNDPGGVLGARLPHTWGAGTGSGTGLDTVTLTLTSHSTADPSTIPSSISTTLKVYDPNIAAPDGLSTKTISNGVSVGISPRLASTFTNNSPATTISAGDNVVRTVSGMTSSIISTFAYDADNGVLQATVNDVADGQVTLDATDNSGTYGSLEITEESDYNLLNSSGSATTFNQSIYYPGLYKGFKARVSNFVLTTGVHTYQLSHSTTGSTNIIEFVKDDVTTVPAIGVGTVSEGTGNYRYISGIPYYNAGSTLVVSGMTLDSFIGQTYRDTAAPATFESGNNYESSTGDVVNSTNYTYSQISGTTPLTAGGIPIANSGNGTPYSLGDLTVPITSTLVRAVGDLNFVARNVNGESSEIVAGNKIQVHTASQTEISEIAIEVSNTLGETYLDDGKRIFDFSAETTNTPVFNSVTNYYTNNPYSESADPGVEGTQEATIRLGTLQHDVTNYSAFFLPVGPNRSADTGTQYMTFAFRRTAVANFDINITSTTGVAGVWIAAPGTEIDNTSTINGWLDCAVQYAGAGVPGADTGAGGNGSNGCARVGTDRILPSTALSGSYGMTLGTENMTNATGNVVLVRIALNSGQSVTGLSIS